MIARGDTTTRERDFADVWLLTRRHPIGAGPLHDAMVATADHRDVTLVRLGGVLSTLATDRQDAWRRYTTRSLIHVLAEDGGAQSIATIDLPSSCRWMTWPSSQRVCCCSGAPNWGFGSKRGVGVRLATAHRTLGPSALHRRSGRGVSSDW